MTRGENQKQVGSLDVEAWLRRAAEGRLICDLRFAPLRAAAILAMLDELDDLRKASGQ